MNPPPTYPPLWESAFANLPEAVTGPWLTAMERRFGQELAGFAATQISLRKKARRKFAKADQMVFVAEALEQATSEAVADFHAGHFPHGVTVVDGTCGIGGDLIALAKDHSVVGYELDPLRGNCARWNLHVCGLPGAVVSPATLPEYEMVEYGWFDPGRRQDQARLKNLADYSPNPCELAKWHRGAELIGIKLSPMDQDEDLLQLGPRLEFVSYRGQCLEAVVWFGKLIGSLGLEAGVYAVQVETGEILKREGEGFLNQLNEPQKTIYEADPAAIRAHGLIPFGIPNLGDRPGYLTTDKVLKSPWLTGYEVIQTDGFDLKRLKKSLKDGGFSVEAIKSRAAGIVPEKLIKEFRGLTGESAILIFYEVKKKIWVAITRKVI